MKVLRSYLTNIPLLALLIANVLPLWGVLFLGWDALLIVLLYWAENIAIGFYTVLKIVFVKASSPKDQMSKLFIIPFFIIHYGAFTVVHGLFVLKIFKKVDELSIYRIRQAYSIIPVNMKYVLLAFFVSHGISFVYNYLLKGEYAVAKVESPYGRVFVMHITIIGGAFLTEQIGSPVAVLFVLVVLKIIMDVALHLKEHEKIRKKMATGQ